VSAGLLRRHPRWASGLLLAACLAVSWRRFLLGQRSPFHSDIQHYHDPVTHELARAWAEGRIPLWSDHVYCGFPFFADPQTAAWYPTTPLIVALGPHVGYIVFLFLHSLLAAVGMLALVRAYGGAWLPAWVAGLVVALCGYLAHETQHPGYFAIHAWMPVWLLATHAIFVRPTALRAAAAAAVMAAMVFTGALHVATGAVIVFAAYVVGSTVDVLRERGLAAALRAAGTALGAQALGLALAAVVLLPTLAHIAQSVRALAMTPELAATGSVHPWQLVSLFVGAAAARLGAGTELDFGAASFYVGALTLPLALVGLGAVRGASRVALAAGGTLVMLLAMGRYGPVYPVLADLFPSLVTHLLGIGRAIGAGSVLIALLAGLGLHRLGEGNPGASRAFAALLAASLVAHAVILATAPDGIEAATVGSAVVVAAALVSWAFFRARPRVLRPALGVLVAVDLLALGAMDRVLETYPASAHVARSAGVREALADIAGGGFGSRDGRVLLAGLGPRNLPVFYDLDGAGGYNPFVLLRYVDFASLVNDGRPLPREPLDRFVLNDQPNRINALANAASIRFLISYVSLPHVEAGLRLLRRYEPREPDALPANLYENPAAMPRAYLAYRTRRAAGVSDFAALLGRGFDARATTVVEGDAEPLDGPPEIRPVEVTRERPERLHLDADAEHPAVLVVADAWYPGWRAWVDGAESPVLPVNGVFRGVAVGPGRHRVEMRFVPWTFRVGGTTSAVAACVLLILAAPWPGRRGRRPSVE
jgi:hypothetical protein